MQKIDSFEDKLERLKKIVEELEKGDLSLKDSMEKYEESLGLIKQCHEELENAELKIERIIKKDGRIITETLEKM